MPISNLSSSPVLKVERFSSFDEFRPNDVIGGGRSFPRHEEQFSASRACLVLPASRLVLQRSFARRLEADIGAPGAGLIIPMSPAFHAEINGRQAGNTTVALFRGTVPSTAIEPHANSYLMLRFPSAMQTRNWSDFESGFELFTATPLAMENLRHVILEIMRSASTCADSREFARRSNAMQETLLAALDGVLGREDATRSRPRSLEHYRKIVARLDELVTEATSAPLYSDDLAASLGVSVRTLQTATRAAEGMALHQYLRLKRLWLARCRLTSGLPGLSVKDAALLNGFWHLGEFSQSYKAAFGELASETLARAQARR
jgi:AraC-like DNA-binding protein